MSGYGLCVCVFLRPMLISFEKHLMVFELVILNLPQRMPLLEKFYEHLSKDFSFSRGDTLS